ncbi:FAD/NAD(P)-binding domain-containing protein [Laetiporus sulphureus 93-53]|uniref:FAD/NAD(P)-binding domain-containing protein n=1 Tax=Laetiporus sulphureus 93-53 TaxID=1314785 RepID=A0A165F7F1_9APHY|nr:FAD/NAD(P)-binding domain-containing protein [Laetiporus sulphureus 93-53]KZT08533.1 FAD/NAD(P)-binding domain-containing protein [Laetiporus sulphureus 93-53]
MQASAETNLSQRLKVAIVGGGVCGLTCAIALARVGIRAEIFEAAPHFGEIGAGIGIGPNAARVFESIGVLDEVCMRTQEPRLNMRTFLFISGQEGHELLYEYPGTERDSGLGAYRPSLLDALVRFVDPSATHFNRRCTSYSTSESNPRQTTLHFSDGMTYDADVVIGADGIKSSIRASMLGEATRQPVYSNTVCYRGLIPIEKAKAAGVKSDFSSGRPVCYMGKDKHIIVLGIKGGTILNIVAFSADHEAPIGSISLPAGESWVNEVSQDEMLQVYEGWGSEVTNLLKCLERPSKWSINFVHPALDSYVKGRVALIGDAAHAMLPHLGAGAGQGLEDAYLLAQLLGHPQTNPSNIEIVLQAYDRLRRPRAQMVWNGSMRAGEIYDGWGEHGLSAEGVEQDIKRMWDPVWHHDINDDVRDAVEGLKDAGVLA